MDIFGKLKGNRSLTIVLIAGALAGVVFVFADKMFFSMLRKGEAPPPANVTMVVPKESFSPQELEMAKEADNYSETLKNKQENRHKDAVGTVLEADEKAILSESLFSKEEENKRSDDSEREGGNEERKPNLQEMAIKAQEDEFSKLVRELEEKSERAKAKEVRAEDVVVATPTPNRRGDKEEAVRAQFNQNVLLIANSHQGGSQQKSGGVVSFTYQKKESPSKPKDATKPEESKEVILPGSSFFGVLSNSLYSLTPNMRAVVKIHHKAFIGCNFVGRGIRAANNVHTIIELDSYHCSDGRQAKVKGMATNMDDFSPVFADEINRNWLPRIAIVTADGILNGLSLMFEKRHEPKTTTDLTNMQSVKEYSAPKPSIIDYIQPNRQLTSQLLSELLQEYKTETIVKPQPLIVFFF